MTQKLHLTHLTPSSSNQPSDFSIICSANSDVHSISSSTTKGFVTSSTLQRSPIRQSSDLIACITLAFYYLAHVLDPFFCCWTTFRQPLQHISCTVRPVTSRWLQQHRWPAISRRLIPPESGSSRHDHDTILVRARGNRRWAWLVASWSLVDVQGRESTLAYSSPVLELALV